MDNNNGTQEGSQTAWYDSLNLSDEYKGLAQVKNFKDANDLFKSYKNLESLTGVDKNEIIRIPKAKEGETPDYSEVFKALGRPDDVAGYELPDNDFAKAAAQKLFDLGLSKNQAKGMADWFDSYQSELAKTQQETAEANQQRIYDESVEALKKEWAAKYDENLNIAKIGAAEAAKNIGLTEDVLDKIGAVIGIDMAAKLFYSLGIASGSASDGSKNLGDYSSHVGNETPEVAKYKLSEMYSDPETAKKIASGDKKTFDELNRLNAIIAKSKFGGGNN